MAVFMEFIVITGLSGAGKTQAANALEDLGFACARNLSPQLLGAFYKECESAGKCRAAAVLNSGDGNVQQVCIFTRQVKAKILYLTASMPALWRRFQLTRRRHPFMLTDFSLEKAIEKEREALVPLHEHADYVIDTSVLSNAQLKEHLSGLFLKAPAQAMAVHCLSFGYKYGPPDEASLVFDVRCLPNPYYVPDLKERTGREQEVRDYVLQWPQAQHMLGRLRDLLDDLLPLYAAEGKSQLVVAIGCTGGKQRSVTFVHEIAGYLRRQGRYVLETHRDVDRP